MKCTRNRKLSFLPIALALLAGCGLVSRDEVARVASPDGRVEGVLVETNGGATTPFGYEVHVVEKGRPAGDRVAWLSGAGRNAQAYGANLKWTGENELVIEYLEARDQTLERKTVSVAGRAIKVSLRSGVNDPTAPAGGMLYNLELTRGGKER
jgi:hypothetical protein